MKLLDAAARAKEATDEVLELAVALAASGDEIESNEDPLPSPPNNITRETIKTSPRLPFRLSPPPKSGVSLSPSTAYSHTALTGERALAHVLQAWSESKTAAKKAEVAALARKLVDGGFFTAADVADILIWPSLIKPKGPR